MTMHVNALVIRSCGAVMARFRQLVPFPKIFGTTVQTGASNLPVSSHGRDWPEAYRVFNQMCAFLRLLEQPAIKQALPFARHRF